MRNNQWILVVTLLLLGLCQPVAAAINIQHWTTDNGARVYFVAAPELPMVDLQVTFNAGAARDTDGKAGAALLTNAMLPEGAGKLSAEQISERFDELGARFGSDSERDMSTYTLRSLSEEDVLTPALETLATVLGEPTFPRDAFERERKRLLIGIEQRKQSPGALADEAFYEAVFQDHPYGTMPSGYEETVKSLTVADLKAFYDRYFVASNATIAIVGNLDRAKAEQVANRAVAKLKKGEPAPALPKVDALEKAAEVKVAHPSSQTHILLGQPGMHRGDPDYYALYVGNHILGGSGLVARLSNEIREKRGLAYSTYSYFLPMRKDGPFEIGLQTRNDQAEEALKVVRETVKDFITNGPTEEELTASKKNITGGFPLRISSNKKILGYIGMIGFYQLPLDYLDTFNDKVQALTVADIQDAFKRRVHPDKMVTIMVGPAPDKVASKNP
ncbi:MAG: pitrilysin family protein [Gammaproteobacteria bacterium]|jgi:zinc protease